MNSKEVRSRFLQCWGTATDMVKEQAATWYWRAHRDIRDIYDASDQFINPFRVTALFAVNSSWAATLTRLKAWANFVDIRMLPVVRRAYESLKTGVWKTGAKTMAFAELLGQPDAERMALDRHVLQVLGLKRPRSHESYRVIESIGLDAAKLVGVQPGTLQACLWITNRGAAI